MLKIQILGSGMIPRGGGIAPKKAPMEADIEYIELILKTPGLKVNMFHPVTGAKIALTLQNLNRMWKAYAYMKPAVKEEPQSNEEKKDDEVSKVVVPEADKNRYGNVDANVNKEDNKPAENDTKETDKTEPASDDKKEDEQKENKSSNENGGKNKNKFKPINNDKK